MIAKNFMKFPEALRFQRELFSNGYHNSPRIMRLIECVFDWRKEAPDWWEKMRDAGRALAKKCRKAMFEMFDLLTKRK